MTLTFDHRNKLRAPIWASLAGRDPKSLEGVTGIASLTHGLEASGASKTVPCLHTTSSWCCHTSCLIIVLFRSSVRTTRALTESSSYMVCFTLHFSYAQHCWFFRLYMANYYCIYTYIAAACTSCEGQTKNELLLISRPSTEGHKWRTCLTNLNANF